MVVIHHVFDLIAPYIVVAYSEVCVYVVSMSSSIRSSLRREQLHVCSVFELIARLCARVDVIDKAEVKLPYKLA